MSRKYIHSIKGKYFLSVSELVIITALTTFAFYKPLIFSSLKHFSGLLETMSPVQFLTPNKTLGSLQKSYPQSPVPSLSFILYIPIYCRSLSSIFHRQLNLIVFQSEIILSSLIFYLQIRSSVYSSFWLMNISKLNVLVGVSLLFPSAVRGKSPSQFFLAFSSSSSLFRPLPSPRFLLFLFYW